MLNNRLFCFTKLFDMIQRNMFSSVFKGSRTSYKHFQTILLLCLYNDMKLFIHHAKKIIFLILFQKIVLTYERSREIYFSIQNISNSNFLDYKAVWRENIIIIHLLQVQFLFIYKLVNLKNLPKIIRSFFNMCCMAAF